MFTTGLIYYHLSHNINVDRTTSTNSLSNYSPRQRSSRSILRTSHTKDRSSFTKCILKCNQKRSHNQIKNSLVFKSLTDISAFLTLKFKNLKIP